MASKQIITVDVRSNLDDLNAKAEALKVKIEALSKVQARVPLALLAARKGIDNTNDTSRDSGMARSMGGGTGSASRDFAKQAQGLGGLVHVYATFAANIYAVSTAFSALSKAADTTNMVKGLDQLGASSGRSLSNLAKQMATVADGALSMRDAISSTAIASAGGMTNASIIRMTEVARKASLALGRDMTDSMDRLTKGIVKIQPELLDELGIMARVIPSQEAYARKLGKTAASLTDFEKRQAFANAVLEEGERKFSSINIDANPYSKLSANLVNLTQNGLSLINTVLTPLLNLLSQSPTALTTAMSAIGLVLLKQAMPAIGYFKESMRDNADFAQKLANTRVATVAQAHREEIAKLTAHTDALAQIQVDAADKAAKRTKALAASTGNLMDKGTKGILDPSRAPTSITAKEYSTLEYNAMRAKAAGFNELSDAYKENIRSLKAVADSELHHHEVMAKGTAEIKARDSVLTTIGRTQVLADRANLDAASRDISSRAAQTASVRGFRAAMIESFEAIKKARSGPSSREVIFDTGTVDEFGKAITSVETVVTPKMGKMRAGWTAVASGVGAATSALGTMMNFMGPWIALIGILGVGLAALNDYFTQNTRQVELFTKALESGTDAIKVATDVYTNFNNIPLGTALSSEVLLARATAINTLTDSIADQVVKYKEVLSNSGKWDRFTDDFWRFFGKGASNKLADTINSEVTSAIKLMNTGKARDAATKALAISLDLKPTAGLEDINKAIEELGRKGEESLPALLKVSNAVGKLDDTAQDTISVLSQLNSTSDILSKASADFNNSLIPTTAQDKFGIAVIDNSLALAAALQDPINGITGLNELVSDSSKLSLFSPKQAKELIEHKDRIQAISKEQQAYEQSIPQLEASLAKLRAAGNMGPTQRNNSFGDRSIKDNSADIREQTKLLDIAKQNQANNKKEAEALLIKLNSSNGLIVDSFSKGMAIIDQGLTTAASKAAVIIGQANLSGIAGRGVGEESNKLRQQSISTQMTLVEAMYQNTLATIANNNAIERASAVAAGATSTVNQIDMATAIIEQVSSGKIGNQELSTIMANAIAAGEQNLVKALLQFKQVSVGRAAQMTDLTGQSTASNIQGRKDAGSEALAYQLKLKTEQEASNKLKQEALTLQNQYSGLYSKELETAKDKLETSSLSLKQESAKLILENQIADMRKSGQTGIKAYADKLAELEVLKKQQSTEEKILSIKQAAEAAGKTNDSNLLKLRQGNELLEIQESINSAEIAAEQSRLSAADSLGYVNKEYLALAEQRLASQSLDMGNTQAIRKIEEDRLNAMRNVAVQKAADDAAGIAHTEATLTEEKRINDLFDYRVTAQSIMLDKARSNLEVTKANAIEQAKTNKLFEELASLTDSLGVVFGDVGTSIGNMTTSLVQAAEAQNKLTKQKQEELKAAADKGVSDPAEVSAIEAKYAKESSKAKLDAITKEAGAAKKLFGEKTAAFKVLDKVEKASAAMKMALQIKEMAMEAKNFIMKTFFSTTEAATAITADTSIVASKAATAPLKVAADTPGILSSFSSMGPVGFAVGAALVAALVAMAGGGGKSVKVDTAGLTSADRQATQGTGQAWVMGADGKRTKQDTGMGTFGDSEAKSTSIVDSLEIMKANSIEGLNYDNKMLKALETLADSVKGAAKSLYSIPGLRQGTNFGTAEGNTKGTTGILELSSSIFGKVSNLTGLDMFGTGSKVAGKLVAALFGGKTSANASIISAGIELKGTFNQVADDVAGSITQFKDVLVTYHKSGGLFGRSKDWQTLNRENANLSKEVSTALSDIFRDAKSVFVELGKQSGTTRDTINKVLSTFNVSMPIDIMNLKGQELVDELNAVIGSTLSGAANLVFPELKKFRNFGEDYLATAIRVIDGSLKVDLALTSMGKAFSTMGKLDISEAMINAAGGLDTFMSQTSNFVDSFLTEAEKLEPVQKSVNNQLVALGISTDITKKGYKDLVLAQNLNTESGRVMYQNLMELATGFSMTSAAAVELSSKLRDLYITLLNTQGKTAQALELTRAKTLEGMSAEEASMQRQIFAAEDANKTREITLVLMGLEGKTSLILASNREKELLALSDTNAEIQRRIYILQDEAKYTASESALYTALGDSATALYITRTNELKTIEDILKPAKKYLYALQDEATLKGKLTTEYNKQSNAIKNTITSLTASIKTLKDYQTSLTAGAASTLTPAEKYAQAKAEVTKLAALAQATIPVGGTEAQIAEDTANRNDAISKLSAASNTFLETSKEMFAMGSSQYSVDFSAIMAILDNTTGSLDTQKTAAEVQLQVMNDSLNFLDVIAGNTDTISSLMEQWLTVSSATYTAQQAAITSGSSAAASTVLKLPGYATGGLASGLSVVGEVGPEVVDFKTPGRVYSNRASNDLFNNKELIAEIRNLRNEVKQLRAEQKEQTGHLIASNYDANDRNATAVADATEKAISTQDWQNKSKVQIV